MPNYDAVPLPQSRFGQRLYTRGRELVEAGVRLDAIVWDADEVLWDWVMSAASVARRLPWRLHRRDMTHREFVRLRPGVWELLWGMHHASLEAGLDPYMRIWTAGYSWRLWRIAQDLPGFCDLVGPPADVARGPTAFEAHPRIMCRGDTVTALLSLLEPEQRSQLDALPLRVRHVVLTNFHRPKGHSGLKLPELAPLVGRTAFAHSRVLVDDTANNTARFAATGRSAIRIDHPAPRIFGRLPNSVWSRPHAHLTAQRGDIANPLADALAHLAAADYPARSIEVPARGSSQHATITFTLEVPGDIITEQWFEPMRSLRDALGV